MTLHFDIVRRNKTRYTVYVDAEDWDLVVSTSWHLRPRINRKGKEYLRVAHRNTRPGIHHSCSFYWEGYTYLDREIAHRIWGNSNFEVRHADGNPLNLRRSNLVRAGRIPRHVGSKRKAPADRPRPEGSAPLEQFLDNFGRRDHAPAGQGNREGL